MLLDGSGRYRHLRIRVDNLSNLVSYLALEDLASRTERELAPVNETARLLVSGQLRAAQGGQFIREDGLIVDMGLGNYHGDGSLTPLGIWHADDGDHVDAGMLRDDA